MGYPDDEIRGGRVRGQVARLSPDKDPLPGELNYFPFAEGYYGVGTPLKFEGGWKPQEEVVNPIRIVEPVKPIKFDPPILIKPIFDLTRKF
jgi:hypothetical protein